MKMGANSQSFLREPDFTEVFSQNGELETILRRDSEGKIRNKKGKIIKMMHSRGFDRQLIINATMLQNYKLYELKRILKEFRNTLNYLGCEGVLELHPQDTTQNSYHFHFWTNNDSEYTYNIMRQFVLDNNLANERNVDIAGKYAKFTRVEYEDGKEKYIVQDLKSKKEMIEANKAVKSIISQKGVDKDEYRKRILKSVVKFNRTKGYKDNMQRLPRLNLVYDRGRDKVLLSAHELLNLRKRHGRDTKLHTTDYRVRKDERRRVDVIEALSKAEEMLKKIKRAEESFEEIQSYSESKHREIEKFFGNIDEKDDWRSQLSQIPENDGMSRIELLKRQLDRR